MAAVAGPEVPRTEGNRPASAGAVIPWRRATTARTSVVKQTGGISITAAQQNILETIEGTGFMTGIDIEVIVTTAGNAAATAYQADAPWSALASIVLQDPTGEELNLTGYDLYLANIYGGYGSYGSLPNLSTDTLVYQALTGAGATGGSFNFHLRVPVAINTRNYLGLLGNQDRAIRYQLRTDIAPTASIYTTGPTTPGTVIINRTYESVVVPSAKNSQGLSQEMIPPKFGVQHFLTRQLNQTPPSDGLINHYLPRVGNTIRTLILIIRINGVRATNAQMPTRVQFMLGDTVLFTESSGYRRKIMRDHYGFDAPAGVLVYDWQTDILPLAGGEFGLDYLWTAGISQAQFQMTYPTIGSTNNSLVVITDDLIVPDAVDIYAPDGV